MVLSKKRARKVLEEIIALYPDAPPSLNFNNPFELLIAVTLSAQTTDVAVNKVTPALFQKFPDPASLAASSPAEIEPYIATLGLYRNKSKFIHQTAIQLLENFNGHVPQTREELMTLSGVGRKTANVVLSVGFNIPAFAVDTHVSRICKHHKIVPQSATPLQIEARVCEVLPKELWTRAHQALIYFGREICHPKNPICHQFPQLYQFD